MRVRLQMKRHDVYNNGYTVVLQVLSSEEIGHLLSDLERSAAQRSRAGMRHLMSNPAVEKLARDHRMVGLAVVFLAMMLFLSKPLSLTNPRKQIG